MDQPQLHQGPPRMYLCPHSTPPRDQLGWLDLEGAASIKLDCGALTLEDGYPIPTCIEHDVQFKKRSWKSAGEKLREIRHQTFFYLPTLDLHMFKDRAKKGTAKCRMCMGKIAQNDERVGFDCRSRIGHKLQNGFTLTRQRWYVHKACLVDALFDGTPGRGCPGCSAKREEREFQAYKKMLAGRATR